MLVGDSLAVGLVIWLLLSFFLLFAMVPFSAAVIFPDKRPERHPLPVSELRANLLALNDGGHPFHLVPEASDRDLHLEWDVVDSSWHELFARVKLSTTYRARM